MTLDGKFAGYISNKSKLQKDINDYMKQGNGENVSFVDITTLPEYSLCLVKKDTATIDTQILSNVEESGTTYYRYYAIVVGQEEKYYVDTKQEAEDIINKLKEQNSENIDTIAYTEINSTELKDFSDINSVVTALYVKPKPVKTVAVGGGSSKSGAGMTGMADASSKPVLGISLIQPISGTITATFREKGYSSHTGVDIAGPIGTTVIAAAGGTVEEAGPSGTGYGILIKISNGNGVETLYGHLSKVYVTPGQYVAQGESIGARGSTGNSTGPHLHFEIRVNGVAVNPQNYLY